MYRSLLATHRVWKHRISSTSKLLGQTSTQILSKRPPYRGAADFASNSNHESDPYGALRTEKEEVDEQGADELDLQSSTRDDSTTKGERRVPDFIARYITTPKESDNVIVEEFQRQKEFVGDLWRHEYEKLYWLSQPPSIVPDDVRASLELHQSKAEWLLEEETPKVLSWKWRQIGENDKPLQFSMLVGALARSAKDALTILECITDQHIEWRIHLDCLFSLRNARWEEIQADEALTERFWRQVELLRELNRWPKLRIRDSDLDLLLQNLPNNRQLEILSWFEKRYKGQWIAEKTLLELVCFYTRLGDVDKAISHLRCISPEMMRSKSLHLLRRCMNLLELESVEKDGSAQSFKILPALLELGFVPDDLIYDLVTQNSVKFGLPAVAWDIFRYARSQGMPLGSGTHCILLKDSYLRRDTNNLNELLSIIQARPDLYQSPSIVASMINIIRNISFYERKSGSAEALARMLAFYDKAYTRAPLTKIGLLRQEQAQYGNPELPEPDPLMLAFMVFSVVMLQENVRVVDELWERLTFRSRLGGHELLQEASDHTFFYDGFLCFYAREEKHIPKALLVLRTMLDGGQCSPGDISWSIVVNMFLRHGKDESAEHVRQMMLQRGVPVTEEAWSRTFILFPHSEIAQEVRRRLEEQKDGSDHGSSEATESGSTDVLDVTSAQAEKSSSNDTPLNSIWKDPGMGSLVDLTEAQKGG